MNSVPAPLADDAARLFERVQGSCERIRSTIESLNEKTLNRRELAAQLGLVLKSLEGCVYASVGDSKGQVSALEAPHAGGATTTSEMMRIALDAKEPATSKVTAKRASVADKLSEEQREAAVGALKDPISKVEARPGSGKTTFLVGLAEMMPSRGTYVAYNKDIQRDAAERFPKHVLVRTMHALAFAAVASPYTRHNKPIRDYQQAEVVQLLGLNGEGAGSIAYAARETLSAFLSTLDERVGAEHVPGHIRIRISRRMRAIGKGPEDALAEVERRTAAIARYAQQLWEIAREVSGRGALPHDGYLKLWLENGPRIDTSYLLIDEAQDLTPVMKAIFDRQDCKKVYVGDRYQSINAYRGAINAMQQIDAPTYYLTRSFRFGKNIARVANWVLDLYEEKHQIKGVSMIPGVVGPIDKSKPYTILARTNAALCVRAAEIALSAKAAVVGGAGEMTALMRSAYGLYAGRRELVMHPTLVPFDSFSSMRSYAEASSDKDCSMLVRMMEEHGGSIERIIETLSSKLVPESEAQVILSTAHKAKGREWDQVLMDDDFQDLYDSNGKLRNEEANLLHVAATRAKIVLQPNARLMALDPDAKKVAADAGTDGIELDLQRRR